MLSVERIYPPGVFASLIFAFVGKGQGNWFNPLRAFGAMLHKRAVPVYFIPFIALIWLGLAFFNTGIAAEIIDHSGAGHQRGTPCSGSPLPESVRDGLVFPDGKGLPAGSGTAAEGAQIFQRRCQNCHGREGIGASSVELVGDHGSLDKLYPVKSVGSYWPAAPTVLSFIQQAMPPQNSEMSEPRLSNDESYAVVAYILTLNGLWPGKATLDARELASIRMPNRAGFNDSELAKQAALHQMKSRCTDQGK